MSVIYKSKIIDTNLSKNAMGGTELIRSRLLSHVDNKLLDKVAIHFSRSNKIYPDVKNIFYAHDLPEDQSNNFFYNNIYEYDKIIFVSNYQKNRYLSYNKKIPLEKTAVIYNAFDYEDNFNYTKRDDTTIKFVYHTTPHRGLNLLYFIFDELCKIHPNIELDVYSSFDIYGWGERDNQFNKLFNRLKTHKKINYNKNISHDSLMEKLNNYHIFLYPSIWEETYCLALTEAISKGVMCIHNDFGALKETSFGNSLLYEYSSNSNENASRAFNLTNNILKNFTNIYDNHIKNVKNNYEVYGNMYSMNKFVHMWERTLEELNNE